MIECPSCRHQEFVGAVYCSECGTRLVRGTSVPTIQISREVIEHQGSATKPTTQDYPELASGAVLGLRVVSSGQIVSLVGRDNFTLGRVIAGQAVIPDVDLEPYEAHDRGVSRMHAEIRLDPDSIRIIDLESANGTLLNGKRLEPQVPTPIHHGDFIQLGSMSLQLISSFRTMNEGAP